MKKQKALYNNYALPRSAERLGLFRGLRTERGLKFWQHSEVRVIMMKIGDLFTILSFFILVVSKLFSSNLVTSLLCGV